MIHEIELSPELIRLAQLRLREMAGSMTDEIARQIAQEAILNSDPEAGLLLDEDQAFSSQDSLVAAFGVNDVVVNGCRLDVRAIDEKGEVEISRSLINESYMTAGTLAVDMSNDRTGKVVSYISATDWQSADQASKDQAKVSVKPRVSGDFDLATTLTGLKAKDHGVTSRAPAPAEVATFIASPSAMPVNKQRDIVESSLGNPQIWTQITKILSVWSKGKIGRMLGDSAVWNKKLERATDVLSARFKKLKRDEIKKIIAKTAESYGGQFESPNLRKAMLSALTRRELSMSLTGSALQRAGDVAEAVISGRAVAEAIEDVTRNPMAVKIAKEIKQQRQNMTHFLDASAQEIAFAFQQLSLKPAYATHKSDPSSGVSAINETLTLLDAAEMADSALILDDELANI